MSLLDPKFILIRLAGYDLSVLEAAAIVFSGIGVLLTARKRIAGWPVGIVGVTLYAILFYKGALYSDAIESSYYVVTGFYGWALWKRNSEASSGHIANPQFSPKRTLMIGLATVLLVGLAAGVFMRSAHLISHFLFPIPAAFPMADAITTVASFYAQLLQAHRRTECWIYWIVIDLADIVIYALQGWTFTAILYGVYVVLAVFGLVGWIKGNAETASLGPGKEGSPGRHLE